MNLYFLVEGKRTESKVYAAWLPMLFAGLRQAFRMEDLQGNHFFIVSANGYPFGKGTIAGALSDVYAHGHVDRLFVCIDAEEEMVDVRRQEVEEAIQQSLSTVSLSYSIIVQNRTIETWFLGNRRIISRSPQNELLRKCLEHYSVVTRDPEALPVSDDFSGNHALYHAHYLNAVFAEHRMTYRKHSPGVVLERSYLDQLVTRTHTSNHLATFNYFLDVCRTLGYNPTQNSGHGSGTIT